MVAQRVPWILLGFLLWPGTASLPLLMDSLIQALAELEQRAPATQAGLASPAWPLPALDAAPHDPLRAFLLGGQSPKAPEPDPQPLSPELRALAAEVAQHDVRAGREYGVVLAPDGSTVAVEPLLAGLEAGLRGRPVVALPWESTAPPADAGAAPPDAEAEATAPGSVDSLLAVALARGLGLAFLQSPRAPPGLGSEGCWDQLSAPRNFTLLDAEAALTTAFLNGALDGVLLGDHVGRGPEPRPPVSRLLSQYYGAGVAGAPGLRSNFRRQRGAALTSAPALARQVWATLALLQRLEPAHPQLRGASQERLAQVAGQAAEEFTEAFLGCPAIHPRCRWGARPYRGRPTPLRLPLGFLFVHHTYVPAPPCREFARCAADMRAMQRYHQDTQGWDDLGYSFVVGSDGYVYEGRGWHWVGAHTRGHNSRGFGVAVVGNYTAELPPEAALRALRDELPRCALRARLLRPDYALLGHRQLVPTACPGDALFRQLRTWPRFAANVKARDVRTASRRARREPPPVPPAPDLQ
ncbi:N-acetylmuramoyl-L-alanine amidase [Dasypus novemcinctus]|uniref:N-acetylmuramoyl-L-alanine amidase n=1 Tax=Dasypus novemcinctus TaxID=9361 RepID=UPI00265DAA21|nr:N-acetylmuramoyl-L-alanine amidase [Dasypus novemcinctus]